VVLGGYTIPKGASILLSPFVTQRNARFFERPAAFEPERWKTASPPKFAYFPFGGGAKMCIGDAFAKLEGVLVLAVMAKQWRLQCQANSEVLPIAGITLNPERPIILRPVARMRRATVQP
jgi:cytochrome P450